MEELEVIEKKRQIIRRMKTLGQMRNEEIMQIK